jgi:hypothetical protein
MAAQRVADMTVEELKAIVAEVVEQQVSAMKLSLLQEISDLIDSNKGTPAISAHSAYILLKRTEAEQREVNQALIEWLDRWTEEDDEEYAETFEYLPKVLDEDCVSNRFGSPF